MKTQLVVSIFAGLLTISSAFAAPPPDDEPDPRDGAGPITAPASPLDHLPALPGLGGGNSNGGSSSGTATGGWGTTIPLILAGVALVLAGLLFRRKAKEAEEGQPSTPPPGWKAPAALLAVGLALMILGLGPNLGKVGIIITLVLAGTWTVTQWTSFKYDDLIVYGGSVMGLVLSLAAKGVLGSWNPMTPGWWALECIWVIWTARAVLGSQSLKGRDAVKVLFLVLGWLTLLLTA